MYKYNMVPFSVSNTTRPAADFAVRRLMLFLARSGWQTQPPDGSANLPFQ